MNKTAFLCTLSFVFFSLQADTPVKTASAPSATKKKTVPKPPPAPIKKKKPAASAPKAPKKIKEETLLKNVDKIAVVIYVHDTDEPLVLTQSDLSRVSINGVKQKKEDVILSRIMDYEAQHVYKMPVSEDAVNKYVASLQEHHNLDKSRLSEMFNKQGYSYEEGIDELRRMLSIDSLLNFKIKSRLVVPEDDVRTYYNNNLQQVPASFRIKKGFLAKDVLSAQEMQELQDTGKHSFMVEWLTPYWIDEDELADSRKFITTMKEGEIAKPEKVGDGYEIIKLLEKREARNRTFEECYKEIAEQLRAPLFEKMLKAYQQDLLKKYEIVYL